MSDLVQRLRDSVRACRALDRSQLLTEAADEIERLRMTELEWEAIYQGAAALRIESMRRELRDPAQPRLVAMAETLQRLRERLT